MTDDEHPLPSHDEAQLGSGIEPASTNFARINSMGGHEFETLVAQLLSKMGFQIEGRKAAADGGVDMVAVRGDAILGGRLVVQCKRLTAPVGNAVIRELFGVVHAESANKGLLITTSTFTREARRFAEGKPIELIDRATLQDLLAQHGLLGAAVSTGNVSLSPGVQILYSQLVTPLKRIMDESQRVASGLVFLPKENTDAIRCVRMYQRHSAQVIGYLGTLQVLAGVMAATMNDYSPSAEDLVSLRGHVKEILRMATALLEIQKEASSVIPPDQLSTVHALYSRMGPAHLDRLWPLAECIQDVVDGKTRGPHIVLHLDMYIPEMDAINEEMDRMRIASGQPTKQPTARCFIATAAYASDTDPRVVELRAFRDDFLATNRLGLMLIAVYEKVSPPVAKLIGTKEWLRITTRTFLFPIVVVVAFINNVRGRSC